MTRETIKRIKHKNPKFREFYDEDFYWEDKLEIQKQRKKPGKKFRQRQTGRNKW